MWLRSQWGRLQGEFTTSPVGRVCLGKNFCFNSKNPPSPSFKPFQSFYRELSTLTRRFVSSVHQGPFSRHSSLVTFIEFSVKLYLLYSTLTFLPDSWRTLSCSSGPIPLDLLTKNSIIHQRVLKIRPFTSLYIKPLLNRRHTYRRSFVFILELIFNRSVLCFRISSLYHLYHELIVVTS